MTINTNTNGYTAEGIQKMIAVFNKVAEKFFPECEVEHFYYGDRLSMTDIRLGNGHYAHFNITENRVSLSGFTCTNEQYMIFRSMTYRDECYNGKLMQLAKA